MTKMKKIGLEKMVDVKIFLNKVLLKQVYLQTEPVSSADFLNKDNRL